MKRYYTYTVKKIVSVQQFVTIEYLQITPDFSYPEEIHDFCEFIYIESGQIACKMQDKSVCLRENDFFLIMPDTAHSYCANSAAPATIIVVCFKSKSAFLPAIAGIHHLGEDMKLLVRKILSEAKATFVFPFEEKLTLNEHPRLGSQQMIENYIEEMLIRLIQEKTYQQKSLQIVTNNLDIKYSIVEDIKQLITNNLYSKLTLSDISRQILYSKTYINNCFKTLTGDTIMQYYQNAKIKEAKVLLSKGESVASVSEKLCFESPQHFAKVFRRHTGQTPSQYRQHPVL